jgi:O-antigen/teichoic acid export membrane protein
MSNGASLDMATPDDFGGRVKSAIIWRSGTQIVSQMISWGATLAVIRILDPSDYGLFAMTSVVLVFLNFLNGYGFASAIVQQENVEPIRIRQAFGMLILLNSGLAALQLLVAAPLAALYYKEPQVAEMLRWQSLIYLSTPFIVLPEALMTRNLEFKKPAIVNLTAALVGAIISLVLSLRGFGVWTLVFAPIAIFWTRAIALVTLTKFRVKPSFNFAGAGNIFGFGTLLLISHGFWIVQSQSDIFIAGRSFNKHDLGLYAEALFLTSIFAAKFVPPLNEVAFPAYARLQNDKAALSAGFLKAVRLIMLISCPLYLGMSVTAGPLVDTLMGPKWHEAKPIVAVLALAMPVMTLQILFHPALNALGKPFITVRNSIFGAVVMPIIYVTAVQYGSVGLAWGWVIAFPILLAFTFYQARSHIGISAFSLAAAIWPGLAAAMVMTGIVWAFDHWLLLPVWPAIAQSIQNALPTWHALPPALHLATLALVGGATYTALLWFAVRDLFVEVVNLVVKRKAPAPQTIMA